MIAFLHVAPLFIMAGYFVWDVVYGHKGFTVPVMVAGVALSIVGLAAFSALPVHNSLIEPGFFYSGVIIAVTMKVIKALVETASTLD